MPTHDEELLELKGDVDLLRVATRVLRDDLNDEHALTTSLIKAARADAANHTKDVLNVLRSLIADNSTATKALCATIATDLDEKFRNVLAKRDAARRN